MQRAWIKARSRPGGKNLNLNRFGIDIWWQGYSGMRLGQMRKKIRHLLTLEDEPDYLVIHCGGNDLGGKRPILDLRFFVSALMRFIYSVLPNTKIVWSQILPRRKWRYIDNMAIMEKSRKRLNQHAATLATGLGGAYIKYPDIKLADPSFWLDDGVHLSNTGNEIMINTIQGALESIIVRGAVVYPK